MWFSFENVVQSEFRPLVSRDDLAVEGPLQGMDVLHELSISSRFTFQFQNLRGRVNNAIGESGVDMSPDGVHQPVIEGDDNVLAVQEGGLDGDPGLFAPGHCCPGIRRRRGVLPGTAILDRLEEGLLAQMPESPFVDLVEPTAKMLEG